MIGLWAAVLLVALPFAPRVFRSLTAGGFNSPDLEAFRASELLADRFGSNQANLVVVYDDPAGGLDANDPRFAQQLEESLTAVRSLPGSGRISTAAEDPRQVAPDGSAQYVTIGLRNGDSDVPIIESALRPTSLLCD